MSRQSLPRLTPLFGLKRMSGGTLQWRCRAIACAAYFLMYCASAFGTSSSPSSPSEKMRVPSGGSAWSDGQGAPSSARSTARFPLGFSPVTSSWNTRRAVPTAPVQSTRSSSSHASPTRCSSSRTTWQMAVEPARCAALPFLPAPAAFLAYVAASTSLMRLSSAVLAARAVVEAEAAGAASAGARAVEAAGVASAGARTRAPSACSC